MPSPWPAFYRCIAPDSEGCFLSQILSWDDDRLEAVRCRHSRRPHRRNRPGQSPRRHRRSFPLLPSNHPTGDMAGKRRATTRRTPPPPTSATTRASPNGQGASSAPPSRSSFPLPPCQALIGLYGHPSNRPTGDMAGKTPNEIACRPKPIGRRPVPQDAKPPAEGKKASG